MALDHARLGVFVTEVMEDLEREFGDESEFGDLVLVAEIRRPPTEEEDAEDENARRPGNDRLKGEMISEVAYHSTNPRLHSQYGLLSMARAAILGYD
jgi:hypothetical protein